MPPHFPSLPILPGNRCVRGGWLALVCLWLAAGSVGAQSLLTINDPAVAEGNVGLTPLVFTLNLSEPAPGLVTVDFFASGASATAGIDFLGTNGIAVFPPGETNASVTVWVVGDPLDEPDEIVWLTLTNPVNALLVDFRGDGRILDDDPQPSVTLGGASIAETDAGPTNAVISVFLDAASGQTVTLQFTTQSGTATAGVDFTPISGSVTLPPGLTQTNLTITVLGDVLDEDDESFSLALTNAINANLAGAAAPVQIVDNDPLPALTIGDVTLIEGTGGSSAAVFPLSLTPVSGRAVTVDFQTLNGTATGGADFTTTNGTATLAAGVTNLLLALAVAPDANIEVTETFSLRLSNPGNTTLIRTQALATLLDDETRTLTFTNQSPINATLSGAANPYPTPIEISGLVGTVVKVTATLVGVTHDFPDDLDVLLVGPQGQTTMLMSDCGGGSPANNLTLTLDDSAGSALPDLTPLSSGTFRPTDYNTTDVFAGPAPGGPYGDALGVFNELNPNGTWSLFVFDDAAGGAGALTGGWRLTLTLSNLVCCLGGNSDLSVTVSDSPDPVTATSNLTYTIRLINNGPAAASSVTFTNQLPAGVNLIAASTTLGTLTTNATQVSGSINTLGLGVQATIQLTVRPTTFGLKTNRITVQSDKTDPDIGNNVAVTPSEVRQLAPLLTIGDAAIAEGDWGTSNLAFAVTLSRPHTLPVTAGFSTSAGSATANTDYLSTNGILTFNPGVTNLLLPVAVLGDITIEGNESFALQITGLTNALLADGAATGTIQNDDGLPQRVHTFAWSAVAATQYVGVPIPVTITARDVGNNIATTFNGPAKLSAITGSGPEVSIVITEVDTDANDAVEFANVAGSPVDISGWQVTFYDWFRWPAPAASFVVPPDTVCAGNEVFTISDNGTLPGVYPAFALGENLFWTQNDSTNMVAVLLRDADGRVIDFMCAVDAYPGEISSPIFIPASQWSGPPVTANTNAALTYRRTGNADQQTAENFTIGNPDPGTLNAELALPFTGTRALPTTPPWTANFVNGLWTGSVSVDQAVTSAALRATDVPGHSGVSSAFTVLPSVDVGVSLAASPLAVAAGGLVTFNLRATNSGPVTANSVSLTNLLPAGLNFLAATTAQGTFSVGANQVIFNLGTLTPGASVMAVVQAVPTVGGSFTNLATIGAHLPDGVGADNVAPAVIFVNTAPSLPAIGSQFVNEGSPLVVTNSATDADVPANPLSFTLLIGPPGATLSPAGIFTWTPTEADGPSTNLVRVKVDDNSTPNLSATQTWFAVVNEVNTAPILAPVDIKFVLEGSTLLVNHSATDADIPANTLAFTLLQAPTGASLSPGGSFNWLPGEAQGPGTYPITVKVQDNGSPALSATQTWLVEVREYNSPPVLFGLGDQAVNELTTLRITNVFNDPDLPANQLTLTLLNAPTNATLTTNGIFTWTPTETQSPSTNLVTIQLADNGDPPQLVTQSFLVYANEVNAAPVPAAVANRTLGAGQSLALQFTATDADVPTNALSFSLVTAPGGANVTAGGAFSWTPGFDQGGVHPISFRVTDNGIPALSATQSFLVTVTGAFTAPLTITSLRRNPGQTYVGFNGPPGYTYLVEARPLTGGSWSSLGELVAPAGNVPVLVRDPAAGTQKFYRIRNLTTPYQPPGIAARFVSNGVFHLTFTAQAGRNYTVETRPNLNPGSWTVLTNVTLATTNLPLAYSGAGLPPSEFRVTRLALPVPQQRLTPAGRSGNLLHLDLSLAPGLPAALETASQPDGTVWLTLTNLPAFSNLTNLRVSDPITGNSKFYRLKFSVPSAPVSVTSQTNVAPGMELTFFATSNRTYAVQYRDAVGGGAWLTLTNLPAAVTNANRRVTDPAVNQPARFYRVRTP